MVYAIMLCNKSEIIEIRNILSGRLLNREKKLEVTGNFISNFIHL